MPVLLNRRQFLASAALVGIAGALAPYTGLLKNVSLPKAGPKVLRAGHFLFEPDQTALNYYSADSFKRKSVFEWNLETSRLRHFDSDTVVHVVETHPVDSNLAVLGTKRTDQISLVDWNSEREIAKSRFSAGQYYYGHAVFSDDGEYIVTSTFVTNGPSRIAVLEVPSMKIVDQVDVPRGIAHEMANIGNNRFLFGIGNSLNWAVAFGIFDLATKKIEFFDTNFRAGPQVLSITHLKKCGNRFLANVNSWDDKGALEGALVSFNIETHEVKTEISLGQQGLHAEMLSFEYDPTTEYAWITLPRQNEIKVWNLKTDSLVKTIEFPKQLSPNAVSYIPHLSLAIVTTQKRFLAYDSKTLEPRPAFESKFPNDLLFGGFTAHTRLT